MAGNKFRGRFRQEQIVKFDKNKKLLTLENMKILSKPLAKKKYETKKEIQKAEVLEVYDIINQRDGIYAKLFDSKIKKFIYARIVDNKGNIYVEEFKDNLKKVEKKNYSYTSIGEIRLNDIKNNSLELMHSSPEYQHSQLFIEESSKFIEQKLNGENIKNLMKEIEQNEINEKKIGLKSLLYDIGYFLDAFNPVSQVKSFIQGMIGRDILTWKKLDRRERIINLVNSCGIKKVKYTIMAMDIIAGFIRDKFRDKKDENKNNKIMTVGKKLMDYYEFPNYLKNKNELCFELKEIIEKRKKFKKFEVEFNKSENKVEVFMQYIDENY